jgi:hypothetical protein
VRSIAAISAAAANTTAAGASSPRPAATSSAIDASAAVIDSACVRQPPSANAPTVFGSCQAARAMIAAPASHIESSTVPGE